MKLLRILNKTVLVAALSMVLAACSSDDFEQEPIASGPQTCHMELIGNVVGFDQPSAKSATRAGATSSSWNNGDKIFITFYNGSNIISGEATYTTGSGWTVSYDGSLATGTSQKCEARFFVNATFANSFLVTLNSNSEIYEDVNATYSYNNGALTVQASLVPKTSRIRFTGTSGQKIFTTGITCYSTFAPAINQFTTTEAMQNVTVASNGSTPYIYGYFPDEERQLSIIGSNFAYTRNCDAGILRVGESGYMAIPSENSHNNWRNGMYIKAAGVEFKMIPVVGCPGGFFLIGETEVTEALYDNVNGTSSTSQLPKSNISFTYAKAWVEKLNNTKKLFFSIPSSTQWKYAAKGGSKSQNYIYAGSDTPGDVAWYAANSSTKQRVKQKTPNELGIYDMSGNVAEWTTTRSNIEYTYNYDYDFYGGSYLNNTGKITTVSYSYPSEESTYRSDYAYVGFRLILTCQ